MVKEQDPAAVTVVQFPLDCVEKSEPGGEI
jgi:hypothetical protein